MEDLLEEIEDRFEAEGIEPIKPDISALRELSGGDEAFEREVIEVFVRETPELLFRIDLALQNGNVRVLSELLHKYKSSVSLIGKSQLLESLEFLEKECKTSDNINHLKKAIHELIVHSLGIIKHIKLNSY